MFKFEVLSMKTKDSFVYFRFTTLSVNFLLSLKELVKAMTKIDNSI